MSIEKIIDEVYPDITTEPIITDEDEEQREHLAELFNLLAV